MSLITATSDGFCLLNKPVISCWKRKLAKVLQCEKTQCDFRNCTFSLQSLPVTEGGVSTLKLFPISWSASFKCLFLWSYRSFRMICCELATFVFPVLAIIPIEINLWLDLSKWSRGIPEWCYYISAATVSGSAAHNLATALNPTVCGRKKKKYKRVKEKKDNKREVFKYTERLGEVEGWRE